MHSFFIYMHLRKFSLFNNLRKFSSFNDLRKFSMRTYVHKHNYTPRSCVSMYVCVSMY